MKNYKKAWILMSTLCLGTALPALGQDDVGGSTPPTLLLHLPLDNSLAHSGISSEVTLVVKSGEPRPDFVAGRFGQALQFRGAAAVAIPMNLDLDSYANVTLTAWVREEPGATGSRDIFGSGSKAGVRAGVHGGRLKAVLGDRTFSFRSATVPPGQWTFVAVSVNAVEGKIRIYQNDQSEEYARDDIVTTPPRLMVNPDDPSSIEQAWAFVGAINFENFRFADRPMVIDDVHVYEGWLSAAQIADIREGGSNAPATAGAPTSTSSGAATSLLDNGATGATSEGSLQNIEAIPLACNAAADCPSGSYCAIERFCHPDRHAPLESLQLVQTAAPILTLPEQPESTPEDNPATASAGPYRLVKPAGRPYYSAVAGVSSKTTREIDLYDNFMTRIGIEEQSNRPCSISIAGMDDADRLDVALVGCNKTVLEFTVLTENKFAEIPTPPRSRTDIIAAGIRALMVCNNFQDNQRVKGVRLYGGWIDTQGVLQLPEMIDSFERANCAAMGFGTKATCATNFATGVVVHYTRATGRNEQVTGLQLICRAAEGE